VAFLGSSTVFLSKEFSFFSFFSFIPVGGGAVCQYSTYCDGLSVTLHSPAHSMYHCHGSRYTSAVLWLCFHSHDCHLHARAAPVSATVISKHTQHPIDFSFGYNSYCLTVIFYSFKMIYKHKRGGQNGHERRRGATIRTPRLASCSAGPIAPDSKRKISGSNMCIHNPVSAPAAPL
jgi:hypothetical protein